VIYGESTSGYYAIYNEMIFHFQEFRNKPRLCISSNLKSEYNTFKDFLEQLYSPIENAMLDPKNLPTPSLKNTLLKRRKSIIKLADVKYEHEPGKLGTYKSSEYFDTPNKKMDEIKQIMQSFRNDRDENGKIIFNQANANNYREPLLKTP